MRFLTPLQARFSGWRQEHGSTLSIGLLSLSRRRVIDDDDYPHSLLQGLAEDNTCSRDGMRRLSLARTNRMAFRIVFRYEIVRTRLLALAPSLSECCLENILKQRTEKMIAYVFERLENSLKNNRCHPTSPPFFLKLRSPEMQGLLWRIICIGVCDLYKKRKKKKKNIFFFFFLNYKKKKKK